MQKRIINSVVLAVALLPGQVFSAAIDDPLLTLFQVGQLEKRDASGANPLVWEVQGWIGYDLNKLVLKSEGERASGATESAELQLLYSRAIAPYWDLQVGVRHDLYPKPTQTWAVVGVQGIAPYFFETDASLFIGESGQTGLRLEAEYEMLLTQRWVLSPEIELNLYGENDDEREIGSGLADIEAGLRLRYEVRREFAPYVGVNWERKFGQTADFAREAGEDTNDTQLVVGIRAWF